MVKLVNFPIDVVKLMVKDGDLEDETFASVSLNPNVSWAKFILTDDKVNKNKERVPEKEFENLIRTGINMPIKMAFGEIEGHPQSFPIGVITHLKKVKNQIIGLAALWKKERPDDVAYLKEKYNKGEPLDLSWEISYEDLEEKDGIKNLIGTSLNATTLVSEPAYAGRTGITALASKREEEVNALEEKIKELEAQLKVAKDSLAELKDSNKELETALKEAKAEHEKVLPELEELREFKSEIVAEKEKQEKLESIKGKFSEAGIEKSDEYFSEKEEMLLSMDEGALDFLIQESVAFAEELKKKADGEEQEENESQAQELPNFNETEDGEMNAKTLAEALRSRNKK